MPDLLDALREVDPEVVAPPPAEVRRRGDALRRRRRATQVVGAACVVAVAAVGSTYLTGRGSGGRPGHPAATASASPSPSFVAPDRVLTRGWPDPGGDGRVAAGPEVRAVATVRFCGTSAYPNLDPLPGRVTARLTLPDEQREREVTSYRRVALAEQVVQTFLSPALGCQAEPRLDRSIRVEIRKIPLGDESFAVLVTPRQPGAIRIQTYVIARVGRTVVLSTRADEGTAKQANPEAQADARSLALLVDSLRTR